MNLVGPKLRDPEEAVVVPDDIAIVFTWMSEPVYDALENAIHATSEAFVFDLLRYLSGGVSSVLIHREDIELHFHKL